MSPSDVRPLAFGLNLIAYGLVAGVIGAGISGTSMMLHRATALQAGHTAEFRPHRANPPHPVAALAGVAR